MVLMPRLSLGLNRRSAGGEFVGFDFTSLAGLQGWWDANSDAANTESGGNVTQANDLSGNDNHMTPKATFPGPSRTVVGERKWWDFDFSADENLQNMDLTPASVLGAAGDFCAFVVFNHDAASTNAQPIFHLGSQNSERIEIHNNALNLDAYDGARVSGSAVQNAVTTNSRFEDSEAHIMVFRWDRDVGYQLWDETAKYIDTASTSNSGWTFTDTANGASIGTLGGGPTTSPTYSGMIGEVAIYNQLPTEGEISTIIEALMEKWGIENTEDGGSPAPS